MSESRLREEDEDDALSYRDNLPELPEEDDTEPDEYGNEPQPCVRCLREPLIERPVKTTDRGLDCVNGRVYIDPVCEPHKNDNHNRVVWRLIAYAPIEFLAGAVSVGVVTKEQAIAEIKTGPNEDYYFIPENETLDPDQLIDELYEHLNEYDE